MPINEINAPIYIKGKMATPQYPQGHAFRLYFALGSEWVEGAEGDEGNWRISFMGSPVGSVAALVDNIFDRMSPLIKTGSSVSQLELWEGIAGANALVHLNNLPSGNSYGSASGGVASSYHMTVFGSALRPAFRFTVFDGTDGNPQLVPPTQPPEDDDGSYEWMFLRSVYPLATNDGIRLTRVVSKNLGYNRKLARSYGRAITP